MTSKRIASLTLGLFLLGSITLLAAPTREEADAAKYAAQLKSTSKTGDKVTALKELGRLGQISTTLAKNSIPDIMKSLDDKDAKVRAQAAHTIGLVDPENKSEVISKLTKMLKEEKDEPVKEGAAMGLGAMGSDAKDAIGALREAQAKAGKKGSRAYQNAIMAITGKKK